MVHQPYDFSYSQLINFQSPGLQDHFRDINLMSLNQVDPTNQVMIVVCREEITFIQSARHS